MTYSHVAPGNMVRFRYHHGNITRVSVAGNFNGWQVTALQPMEGGWWGADVGPLPPGAVFYKFVTPNGWELDQYNYRRSPDGQNSFLSVEGSTGQLVHRWIHSSALGRSKDYIAYLPPGYTPDSAQAYPFLILMGGLFEGASGWIDNAQVEEKLDRLIVSGQITPMIVVMPDKDDAVFQPELWETYFRFLHEDLYGHVRAEYRTTPTAAAEGLSLGGIWALRLGATFPENFISVSSLSGLVDQALYAQVRSNQERIRKNKVRFRIAGGTGEPEVQEVGGPFKAFLDSLGIQVEFCLNPGIHRWPLWESQIAHSFQFHSHSFRSRP